MEPEKLRKNEGKSVDGKEDSQSGSEESEDDSSQGESGYSGS